MVARACVTRSRSDEKSPQFFTLKHTAFYLFQTFPVPYDLVPWYPPVMVVITIGDVGSFIDRHKEGLGLFALAVIATMRPLPPPPLDRVPTLSYLWGWLHDALNTLINLRSPKPTVGPMVVEAVTTSVTAATTTTTAASTSSTSDADTAVEGEHTSGAMRSDLH